MKQKQVAQPRLNSGWSKCIENLKDRRNLPRSFKIASKTHRKGWKACLFFRRLACLRNSKPLTIVWFSGYSVSADEIKPEKIRSTKFLSNHKKLHSLRGLGNFCGRCGGKRGVENFKNFWQMELLARIDNHQMSIKLYSLIDIQWQANQANSEKRAPKLSQHVKK